MKFDFLNNEHGEQSSKRLFTFLLVIQNLVYFNVNLFSGLSMKQSVEDNLFWLTVTLVLGVASEPAWTNMFSKKTESKTTTTAAVEVKTEKPTP